MKIWLHFGFSGVEVWLIICGMRKKKIKMIEMANELRVNVTNGKQFENQVYYFAIVPTVQNRRMKVRNWLLLIRSFRAVSFNFFFIFFELKRHFNFFFRKNETKSIAYRICSEWHPLDASVCRKRSDSNDRYTNHWKSTWDFRLFFSSFSLYCRFSWKIGEL